MACMETVGRSAACEHPSFEVERLFGELDWCRICGAYRTQEHWRTPAREAEWVECIEAYQRAERDK